MASATPFSSSLAKRPALCRRCIRSTLLAGLPRQQKRGIALKTIEKRKAAEEDWAIRSEKIKNGELPNLWDVLKKRGFVKDTIGLDSQIGEIMRISRIGAYVGIDPTAPSLHVGHLLPLMALYWMYIHGYGAHTVVGGATAKVGDPIGRLNSREAVEKSDMTANLTKVHFQLKRMWLNVDVHARRFGYKKEWAWSRAILNNNTWLDSTSFVHVVHRLFRGMRLGPMLSRDNVKRRLESKEGMPLDEFIYPLMQAWDWWHMYSSPKRVTMQIGGSDQFGNIVSGVDAVKFLRDTEPDPRARIDNILVQNTPIGFTVPLLTDSSGAKFGKSAGNAVWLDPFMTSSFDLYGYFMRRPDADVENLLNLLTFLPTETITQIMVEQNSDPPKRAAHHSLAFEVVSLAHGTSAAEIAKEQHQAVYSKKPSSKPLGIATAGLETYPQEGPATHTLATSFKIDIELPEALIMGGNITKILYASGLAESATQAHLLTRSQGAYVGGSPGQPSSTNKGMNHGDLTFTPVKTWFPQDTKNFLIDGKLLILRRGKHFIRVIKMVSDEDWKERGLSYPGEPGTGEVRKMKSQLLALGSEWKKIGVKGVMKLREDLALEKEVVKTNKGGLRRGQGKHVERKKIALVPIKKKTDKKSAATF